MTLNVTLLSFSSVVNHNTCFHEITGKLLTQMLVQCFRKLILLWWKYYLEILQYLHGINYVAFSVERLSTKDFGLDHWSKKNMIRMLAIKLSELRLKSNINVGCMIGFLIILTIMIIENHKRVMLSDWLFELKMKLTYRTPNYRILFVGVETDINRLQNRPATQETLRRKSPVLSWQTVQNVHDM